VAKSAVSGGSNRAAARALEYGLALAIASSRSKARIVSADSFQRELDIIGADPSGRFATTREEYDRNRAVAIAGGVVSAWLKKVNAGESKADAIASLDSRIETIGITETAEAFNDEREQIIKTVQPKEERTGGFVVFRIWDATLDKLTCPVCERAHHTVVPQFMSFPDGRPGGVHPRCRCYESLILLPFWFDYENEAA